MMMIHDDQPGMTGLGHVGHVKAELNNSKQHKTTSEQRTGFFFFFPQCSTHSHASSTTALPGIKQKASQVDILGLEPSCTS